MANISEDGKIVPIPKPKPRKRKKVRPSGPPEKTIQQAIEAYLAIHGIRYVHIPDCVYKLCAPFSPITVWQKRDISKALKGVPDIIALMDDRVLLLELKRKGGRLRQPQKAWLKGLTHHIVDNAKDGIEIINQWRDVRNI